MDSNENLPLIPIINRMPVTSPTDKYTKRHEQGSYPESMVDMTTNSTPFSSFPQSSKEQYETRPRETHYDISTPYDISQEIQIFSIGYRLSIRKALLSQLALVSDIMNAVSITGIVLMVIANELMFHNHNDKNTEATWFIKLTITITTVILLALIFWYHYLDLKLHSNHNSHEHWYVGITASKICLIAMEVLICAIHPIPRTYPHSSSEIEALNQTVSYSYTSIDVALGLLMFLRLYLLSRSLMFHAELIHNASARSFGYLNQVQINVFFLIKIYLAYQPIRYLLIFCTTSFFIGSWSLRACDYKSGGLHLSISDAMWLFVMTFTTVGYGDTIPSTYCGRAVASIIAITGVILTALLIAVVAQKLLPTREEKYLHNFMLRLYFNKKHRLQAANVMKHSIKTWYLKYQNKYHSVKGFLAQRRLRQAIDSFHQTKHEERNLVDNCIDMKDLSTMQQNAIAQLDVIVEQMTTIQDENKTIKEELNNMKRGMDNIHNTLNTLLDKMTK